MHAKTLLTVMGVDHGAEDLIQVAELAQREQAHLVAAVVSCAPPPPVSHEAADVYSIFAAEWEQQSEQLDARAAELLELLGSRGLKADVQQIYCLQGSVSEEVSKRACYADMTIVGITMLKDDILRNRILDGALFNSPSPVLLLSNASAPTLRPKTVLIAWNSTLEAGASIRSALDIIVHADKVHLALVDPDARPYAMGEEPGADIAAYLARHGAHVIVDGLPSGGIDPAEVLNRHASDIGAELIVMGAYGHSRMRERFFGGMTESMLRSVVTPVLMAR